MTTAVEAVKEALSLPTARFANNLWILLDNLEAARLLLHTPVCSSQLTFTQFIEQASKLPTRSHLSHTIPRKVMVYWILGHKGIQGNSQADKATKDARELSYSESLTTPLSLATAKARIKELTNKEIKNYWAQTPHNLTNLYKLIVLCVALKNSHSLAL